ncbi:MAG: hypothetical protein KBS89_00385 [Bacteroidales bacterium]|nr:hypothetical protein [Candidatus Egerieousia equi]
MIEITDNNGFVIQAFMLMSDKQRLMHRTFPLYNRYHQTVGKAIEVKPDCAIAVLGKDDNWQIYNASDSREIMPTDFINYENAHKKFHNRCARTEKSSNNALTFVSYTAALILVTYFVLYILGNNGFINLKLPLDNNVLIGLAVIFFLFLLPHLVSASAGTS